MLRKDVFDLVAEQYEAVRPAYPPALVEEVIAHAGIAPPARILEVGSGPGTATRAYAERGFTLVCVEPGRNMAERARRALAAFPRVTVVQAPFEAWPVEAGAFDLVLSATAWHHVDPAVRYRRAAQALRPAGALAICAHWAVDVFREGQEAYRRHAPEWTDRRHPSVEERLGLARESLAESGCFENVAVHRFPWTERYDAEGYLALLGTYSDHLLLPAERRRALFDDLRAVIERLGGSVEREFESVLFLATRASGCASTAFAP